MSKKLTSQQTLYRRIIMLSIRQCQKYLLDVEQLAGDVADTGLMHRIECAVDALDDVISSIENGEI